MLWSECVSFSGFCRIKLCGYVPFIVSFKPTVCCWRHFFFFNFSDVLRTIVDESGPRRQERGFGAIWFAGILLFPYWPFLFFPLTFMSGRSPWSLAWTSVHRLSKVLRSHCKKRPNELCSNSNRNASTTYSWWAGTENLTAHLNTYPVHKTAK